MQHCSIPKELTVGGNKKKKKKDAVCHLGKKKVKQIIRMWNFYECLKTV